MTAKFCFRSRGVSALVCVIGLLSVSAAAQLTITPATTPFPSAANIVSWAGICPGNNKAAGKRKSGTTRDGNPWLRGALSEAAWAASKTKGT